MQAHFADVVRASGDGRHVHVTDVGGASGELADLVGASREGGERHDVHVADVVVAGRERSADLDL